MEELFAFLILILVLVILILVISILSHVKRQIHELRGQLFDLKQDIANGFQHENRIGKVFDSFRTTREQMHKEKEDRISEKPVEEKPISDEKEKPIEQPEELPEKEPAKKVDEEKPNGDLDKEQDETPDEKKDKKPEEEPEPETVEMPLTIEEPEQKRQPSAKPLIEKPKPASDWEKFIGENLIPKIAIAVLVLGIGFFVKFAIDKDWINEAGRVAIGLLSGGVLVAIAHRLRKKYQTFSSILVGGGLAIFYFTITLAFQEYHLFPQTLAFIIMLIITAFAVILSITYDRAELAVLAILGGFASPLLISTGAGNYKILFTYITILNIGMLVLAYFKKWNIVNIVSYACTILLYGAWLINEFIEYENIPYSGAFVFATVFFILFFFMNIINNLKENEKFSALEIIVLVSNSFLYYAAGMVILEEYQPELKGLFTACLAIFNFVFAILLYQRKKVDANLVYLLIGLVLTYVSLIAPVQLKGNYITLFWAAEGVLLLWLAQMSKLKILNVSSIIVLILMLGSLVMDWEQLYGSTDTETIMPVIFNKAFVTGIVSFAALVITILLTKRKKMNKVMFAGIDSALYRRTLRIVAIIVLYFVILFDYRYQVTSIYEHDVRTYIYIGAFNFLYILALMIWTKMRKIQYLYEASTILGFIGLLAGLVFYSVQYKIFRDRALYYPDISLSAFHFHYLNIVFYLGILFLFLRNIRDIYNRQAGIYIAAQWFVTITLLIVLSLELDHIVLINQYTPPEGMVDITFKAFKEQRDAILYNSHRIGFPVLWGVISFVVMIIGMRRENKMLRVISLSVFFLILVKLFAFDVWDMQPAGRILAFILLGVLLLVISFLYQKLKRFLLEDNADN